MEDTLEAGVSCAMCGLHMTGEMCSDTSSDEEYVARNVETLSPEVVEHGGLVHLFLEDWELARVALSCHLASDLLCQEFQEAWLLLFLSPTVAATERFSHPGSAATVWSGM